MSLVYWYKNIDLARKIYQTKQEYSGVTEKKHNSAIRQKKVMPEKNQGLWHKSGEVEVGILFLGNDENNVICQ